MQTKILSTYANKNSTAIKAKRQNCSNIYKTQIVKGHAYQSTNFSVLLVFTVATAALTNILWHLHQTPGHVILLKYHICDLRNGELFMDHGWDFSAERTGAYDYNMKWILRVRYKVSPELRDINIESCQRTEVPYASSEREPKKKPSTIQVSVFPPLSHFHFAVSN